MDFKSKVNTLMCATGGEKKPCFLNIESKAQQNFLNIQKIQNS